MPRGKAFKTKGDKPTGKVVCPAWLIPWVTQLIWAIDQAAAPEQMAEVLLLMAKALENYGEGNGDLSGNRDTEGDD